jgi:Protein of unknown function (DUF3072)
MSELSSETKGAGNHEAGTIGAPAGSGQDPVLEKDPSDWVSGDDPMTTAQRSYLDTLARQRAKNCLQISARRRPRSTSIG